MKDAKGNCPGGLMVSEWRSVEGTFANMSPEARTRSHDLLYSGRIHGANLPESVAGLVPPETPGDMYLNRSTVDGSIFENRHELGNTLVHEGKHIQQLVGKSPGFEAAAYIANNKPEMEADTYRYENRNYNPRGWDTAAADAVNWVNRQP
jgi:hypothetical protein